MSVTEPARQPIAALHRGRMRRQVLPKVLGAVVAGVEAGKGGDELPHGGLLVLGRLLWVVGGGGVEKCPRAATELLPIRWTLRRRRRERR